MNDALLKRNSLRLATVLTLLSITGLTTWHVLYAGDPLASVVLPKENKSLEGRLKFARKLVADQKWNEAIDTYAGILRDVGDKLAPVAAPADVITSSTRSLQIRKQVHLDIAALPKKGLQVYQASVKGQTTQWLEAGLKALDRQPLLRIVNEAFCSAVGDEALDTLGDLAFEEGEFHEALQWWMLLTLPPSQLLDAKGDERKPEPGRLLFPQPKVDLARVRAKIVLAYLFDGNEHQAKAEFAEFERRHDDASGHLAGEKGNYAKTLKKWIDKGSPNFDRDLSWPTFAGNAARNVAAPKLPHHRLWADGPAWSISLTDQPEDSAPVLKSLAQKARELSYYPIIVEDRVLLSDGRAVLLVDLFSGKKLHTHAVSDKLHPPAKKSANDKSLSRFTLCAANNSIFAVLGDQRLGPAKQGVRDKTNSFLTCLTYADKDRTKLKQSWQVRAEEDKDECAVFEGTPIVAQGRVYVVRSRAKGLQISATLCCYSADTGKLQWQEELARFTEPEEENPPAVVDHAALTLAGSQLIYCSHRGVLMGIDSDGGGQTWAVKYPSRGPITIEGTPSPRDLGACLHANGFVYAAPMDSDRILCLDPATGQVHWERDRIQVVHLLGCQHGKLIFTTAKGLRAVNAMTGSDKSGWVQPATGTLPAYGRGVIAGGWYFWPTQHSIYPLRLVRVSDGNPHHGDITFSPVQVRQIKPGNMAYANDCLVVAGNSELTGYVAPKHLLKDRQKDAAGSKPRPMALYKLAQSEADAGMVEEALGHFKEAEKCLVPEGWDEELLRWRCLLARHSVLLSAAKAKKDSEAAAKYLMTAAQPEFPPELRLGAQVQLGEYWRSAREPAKSILAYQTMLEDKELRDAAIWYSPPDWHISYRLPWRGKDIANWQIRELIFREGRSHYQQIEAKAKQLAILGTTKNSIDVLEQAIEQYRASEAVREVFPKLIELYEAKNKTYAAIHSYNVEAEITWTFVNIFALPIKRRLALARALEKHSAWEAAREIWLILENNHGDEPAPGQLPPMTVGQLARKHLSQPIYAELAKNEAAPPNLTLPLVKAWTTNSSGVVVPEENYLAPSSLPRLYSVDGRKLTCSSVGNPAVIWNRTLPFSVSWIGTGAITTVVAGHRGIAALRSDDGYPIWCWTIDKVNPKQGGVTALPSDPFFSHPHADVLSDFLLERRDVHCQLRLHNYCDARIFTQSGSFWPNELFFNWNKPKANDAHLNPIDGKVPARAAHILRTYIWQPMNRYDQFCIVAEGGDVEGHEFGFAFSNPRTIQIWKTKPRLPTTLSGEKARVFCDKGVLLVLLPRNYGYDLDRIDPKTGDNVWKPTARLCQQAFEKDAIAFHGGAVYYSSGNTLFARHLDNGNLLWKRELPESVRGWRVKATKQALMVFPGAKDEPQWLPFHTGKFQVTLPVRKQAKYPFSLQVHAYKDGELLQRMEFEGDVTGAGVQFFRDMLIVTAGGKAWGIKGAGKAVKQ